MNVEPLKLELAVGLSSLVVYLLSDGLSYPAEGGGFPIRHLPLIMRQPQNASLPHSPRCYAPPKFSPRVGQDGYFESRSESRLMHMATPIAHMRKLCPSLSAKLVAEFTHAENQSASPKCIPYDIPPPFGAA